MFVVCQYIAITGYSEASNERIFSMLKYIKNELRSKMDDERLNNFNLLYSKKEVTNHLNFILVAEKPYRLKKRHPEKTQYILVT